MNQALIKTNFSFQRQTHVYKGKVRDVYTIGKDFLIMVVTDRISAFDVVLPKGIPFKGQVLNQIADKFLQATSDIVPNWRISTPDPMVMAGYRCDPFPIEMIIRAYLTGSSWRDYKNGAREICGVRIPDGMKEHQAFEKPIITPTTKADQGFHDENISKEKIIESGMVSAEDYAMLEDYTYRLFQRGTEIAAKQGLILVDTKYEFGKRDSKIFLIDEIHTPDSSRYFYKDSYQERFDKGEAQHQLSKEFVREWLIANNFMGKPGEQIPEMTPEKLDEISQRYVELYEKITGDKFVAEACDDVEKRIETNVKAFLRSL